MKKWVLVSALGIILLIAAILFVDTGLWPNSSQSGSEKRQATSSETDEKNGEQNDSGNRSSPDPSQLIEEALVEEYETKPLPETRVIGKKFFPEKKIQVVGGWRLPDDQPMIELQFWEPNDKGELTRCPVRHMTVYRFENNGTPCKRAPVEVTGAGIPSPQHYAYAVRYLLFHTSQLQNNSSKGLVMGRTYRMTFLHKGYSHSKASKRGSLLVKIPKDVPDGKMIVMKLDVSKKFDIGEYQTQLNRKSLRVGIGDDMRSSTGFVLVREASSDWIANYHEFPVQGKNVKCRVKEMGGELALVRKKNYAHVLCYKRSVKSERIKLPEDADIVVRDKDLVSFRLKVPQDQAKSRAEGVGLFYDQDDKIPLAATECDQSSDSVELEFVPGTYFVGFWTGDKSQILGQVTIEDTDSGEVLTVDPVKD